MMRLEESDKQARSQVMEYIFNPKSVAVIGASSDSEKESKSGWVGRLVKFGYKGKVYPINPKATEVLGHKAYPSVGAVPDPIDYAIMAVPRNRVAASLKECVAKGVKVVHIFTAGFSETGTEEGKQLQAELKEIIQTGNTRVIGPNCMGVYSPSAEVTFDIRFPKEKGPIAFISQSGVGGRRLMNLATGRGLRFSKVVSYGNAIDINVNDFLENAIDDPETKVILLYLEGLTDGRRFFELLQKCKKPVVLLKAGLSESGSSAVASHTASLAGSQMIWKALFKQTGAISVDTLEEAVDGLVALSTFPPIKGTGVALVGRGGGIGVVATDTCEREGLKVPRLSAETKAKLSKIVAVDSGSTIGNPVEIGLGVNGLAADYVPGLEMIAADPNIDVILTFLNPEDYLHYGMTNWSADLVKGLVQAKKTLSKPFGAVILQGQSAEIFQMTVEIQRECFKDGVAVFSSLDVASRAVSKLVSYYKDKEN